MKTTENNTKAGTGVILACGVALAAGLTACRGDRTPEPPHQFFPDLDDAPKWNPQTHSEFFSDGRTMRQPPEHAVAFGRQAFVPEGRDWAGEFAQQRADLLRENPGYYTGKDGDKYLEKAPVAFTEADLLRGQERFNIYCGVCHGLEGDGQGMVGRQWAKPVPSFHDPKYTDKTVVQGLDGYIFFTARNGVPSGTAEAPDYVKSNMPGYKHALSVEDTWRVVAYIRALQQSRGNSINDVPADKRDKVTEQIKEEDARAKAAADAAKAAAEAAKPPAPPAAPATGGGK
ncbi:MAG: cytochrome c [Phycisphaerales bacterium]